MDYDYKRYPKLGFPLDAKKSELTVEQWELRREYGRQKQREHYARVCSDPVAYRAFRAKNNAQTKKSRERARDNALVNLWEQYYEER